MSTFFGQYISLILLSIICFLIIVSSLYEYYNTTKETINLGILGWLFYLLCIDYHIMNNLL